jgi:GT2 family glycosyltransferase/membrane protein implicated in regulation of membrane protease activity
MNASTGPPPAGLEHRDRVVVRSAKRLRPWPASASVRPQVSGKFLSHAGRKLLVRGVTYGTFRPDEHGDAYPPPATVDRDFAQMAANGINAVRTYTIPPRWLLDLAEQHDLLVMVGIAWEHHVAFLQDRDRPRDIEQRVRSGVRACAGHPAILAYSVGNEIPAPIVRWHGRTRIQRYLGRLVRAAKEEDPDGLVTYVNFPSTEYLELDFVDFLCFNVYLEQEQRLRAYLARLHNLAGDRPLVMAEIGLDSRRNGADVQARVLDWQIRTAFEEGCAGAFVYAWTDEWYVTYLGEDGSRQGGTEIVDWDFGITDRARRPKPALDAVRRAFAETPHPDGEQWPRTSVVVCSYNGAATIGACCEALAALDYPDYEVIVVDDGSSDATATIAAEYGFRVIRTDNRGLSSARNTGWQHATGEIVAYTDDDAAPDPDWLRHLARSMRDGAHAGVGGPNVPPPDDPRTARCVSRAPGNPTHVLLSDREAEHIPGCNCAFRRSALEAVDGFDPRFRVAGDDVDVCWRIRERGWTLGFSPAAMVWHRRRASIAAYLRQQRGYGRAEAQLERKWPGRYNSAGYLTWGGKVYGSGLPLPLTRRARVYHGRWGTAPFQSLYQGAAGTLGALPVTPEWYLLTMVLVALSAGALLAGLPWRILLLPAVVAAAMSFAQAYLTARRVRRATPQVPRREAALVVLLCLMQPAARLHGRLQEGLTPWRRHGRAPSAAPWPRSETVWSERWRSSEARLAEIQADLSVNDAIVRVGGNCDRWEHEVRGGCLASARLRMGVEEHGAGRQLLRFRIYPRLKVAAIVAAATLALLAVVAALDRATAAGAVLATAGVALVARAAVEASHATGQLTCAVALSARREAEAVEHVEP